MTADRILVATTRAEHDSVLKQQNLIIMDLIGVGRGLGNNKTLV